MSLVFLRERWVIRCINMDLSVSTASLSKGSQLLLLLLVFWRCTLGGEVSACRNADGALGFDQSGINTCKSYAAASWHVEKPLRM